jgi:hypothetical protein
MIRSAKRYIDQYSFRFKALESKDLFFSSLVLFFLLLTSASFFWQIFSIKQLLPKAAKAIEKKQVMKERLQLIEIESGKNQSLEVIERFFSEVFNTHLKKELEFVTQFQGFEKLRGHEAKLFLEKCPIDKLIREKNVLVTKEYRETEYETINPVMLSDLELKKLILLIEDLKIKHPAFLFTSLQFNKTMIDEKEKYQVNLIFVLREKILFNLSKS